ncbi:MAG: peptidylprolyl isomerase [Planctomycetes bacterium]|nr:peptidylprolyl isomerase [Planctomycetota bacterium]
MTGSSRPKLLRVARLVCLVAAFISTSFRASAQPAPTSAPAPGDAVVAAIDGQPIRAKEVQALLAGALHGRKIAAEIEPLAEAQALEQLIGRRLTTKYLGQKKQDVTPAEIEARLQTLTNEAAGHNTTLEAQLAKQGRTLDELKQEIAWDLNWTRYSLSQATDTKLESWFKAHRADYDGTEVRASHVLLRPMADQSPQAIEALVKRAALLRDEITIGKMTFAEAAQRYSAGPSRAQDGDVGYFPRHDRMVEPFAAAAFKLKKGEISPPVVTTFGVHVIQCTDIRQGAKPWQDSRDELVRAVTDDLFQTITSEMRSKTKIEYTGQGPHLDPATKQLVLPKK